MVWIISTLALAGVFIFLVGFEVGSRTRDCMMNALKTEIRENMDRELRYAQSLRDYEYKLRCRTKELEDLRARIGGF